MLEGEADIVDAVNDGVIHQRVLIFQLELGEGIGQGLEALKEGFNVSSLGLYPIQLNHNRLKALLGGFKSLRQALIPFLVFSLVKGDMGILVKGLLHHIGNKLCFFQQRGLFRFQLGGVEEQVHHLTAVDDNLSGISPRYSVLKMGPTWRVQNLISALYFSVFYLRPGTDVYRKCANPACNNRFVVKIANGRKKYCCANCRNATARRNHQKR